MGGSSSWFSFETTKKENPRQKLGEGGLVGQEKTPPKKRQTGHDIFSQGERELGVWQIKPLLGFSAAPKGRLVSQKEAKRILGITIWILLARPFSEDTLFVVWLGT